MTRKLLFTERVLYGDGHTPFNGVFAMKLKGRLLEGVLDTALAKVQAKHPLLRAAVKLDEKGCPFFVVREKAPPIPIRREVRRSEEDWQAESVKEWAIPFDTEEGPLLRVVWLASEDCCDLILAFHHCMCDGGSVVTIVRELLALMDHPEEEIGRYEAFTSLKELLPGKSLDIKKKVKARLLSTVLRMGLLYAAARIRTRDKEPPGREGDYLLHWKLDKMTSSMVLGYCKDAQVTVNTVLCVALLSAFRTVRGEKAHNKLMCPVDIRKYNPAMKEDELFAFGLAISLSMEDGDGWGFWRKAAHMQEQATRQMKKLDAGELLLTLEYSHAAVRPMIKVLTYAEPGNDLMFSNLGRVDIRSVYRSFEVETIYSPTIIGPFGNPTTLITTTFRDQMDFCLVSNEACLPRAEAEIIRGKAMQLLIEKCML